MMPLKVIVAAYRQAAKLALAKLEEIAVKLPKDDKKWEFKKLASCVAGRCARCW